MFSLKKISTKNKLYLLQTVFAVIFLFISIYSLFCINKNNEVMKSTYENDIVALQQMQTVSDLYAVDIVDTAHKIRNENITWEEGLTRVENAIEKINENWSNYMNMSKDKQEAEILKQFDVLKTQTDSSIEDLLSIIKSKDMPAMITYTQSELYNTIDTLEEPMNSLKEIQMNQANQNYKDSEADFMLTRTIFIVLTLISIVLSLFFTYRIIKSITKQLNYISNGVSKDSEGKITIKEIKIISNDEIGSMASSINTMTSQVRNFVMQVHKSIDGLYASCNELTSMSSQSAIAANEIAGAIEDIAKGASEQAKHTEEGAVNIGILGELGLINHELMNDLNTSAENVNDLKDEGIVILSDLIDKTNKTDEAIKGIHEVIKTTQDSSYKINNASEMIKNIADQTNLLALNAAIEAARAGEAGRGFAVVAEEIRKLAEQSNEFTDQIGVTIKELTSKSDTAVSTMNGVEEIVKIQAQSVMNTNGKFEGIAQALEKMTEIIEEITSSSNQINTQSDEINGMIENLSAISEENAAGSQEASASVEEQTAIINEMAGKTEALEELANEMKEAIIKFNI